jgi:hypothetical protein
MVAFSFSELLILLALAGVPVNDAASLIDPPGYLKAHDVELNAERLAELIARDPRGGKEQMTQLLAIRWLGAHPDEARKGGALDALRAVAEGDKGRDAYRFARDHAARALARIEGKPAPAAVQVPPGGLREEALSWFPAGATMFGAVDLGLAGSASPLDPDAVSGILGRLLPEGDRKQIYDFVDTVGNLRLDRLAFAVETTGKASDAGRVWVRFTGAADCKSLEAFLAPVYPEREERKGPGGEPIVIRTKKGDAPAFAFIGKSDFLIAGYRGDKENHVEVVEALLDVRAGKGKSVVQGPFADVLKKTGERAQGLFVGDIANAVHAGLLRNLIGSSLAVPGRVVVELTGGKVLTARVRGTMKDEEEAAATAKALGELRGNGIAALAPLYPAQASDLADIGRKALEAAKVEVSGSTVSVTAQVPAEAMKTVLKAVGPPTPPR